MHRIRSIVATVLLCGASLTASAGAAQVATLTVDHPCYYSFGSAHQRIIISGSGFTPSTNVNLFVAGKPYHVQAHGDGSFRGPLPGGAPSIRGARSRITLTGTGGTSTANTRFYVTDVKADFKPSTGSPTRKVRFRITGLGAVLAALRRDPHSRLFAHYVRPNGRLKGTRQFGRLGGPCGDLLTSKTALLPYTAETGTWTVYFDANRRYIRSEHAQVLVTFKVS